MALFASCLFTPLKSNSDPSLFYSLFCSKKGVNLGFQKLKTRRLHRSTRIKVVDFTMFSENLFIGDLVASGLSGGIALSMLRLWEETAKRGFFDQKTNRKLVHISIGLVFMLCWPMFSSGHQGAILAALIPGLNIIKMLLLGLGMWRDDATVKSMSRFGDHRFLHYFSLFGYIQVSSKTVLGFLFMSLAAALVESHPLSSELDDNLTVPLTSVLVGSLVI
ncbi:probable phytol kinase 3, chloroplastic isoform X4 [Capsicum annuum]|uniref:probable phytol kinase 3, chloroplastic isoform X4 n=1 Tax=Capsicum annuum TaxID=4072 RepID=UPI001FB10A5B|nr:probable phytol kinase 3, chloroplastic isoform X4 [Capsicum annuum]